LPIPANLLAKVGIAVTDQAGNLAARILRYLPDDIYLDNMDPQYEEGQGSWSSTTNAAWDTDARLALLSSNSTAEAGWQLPLSWSGRYRISVQVPSLTNLATNVVFNVLTENTNVLSVMLPTGISTNQWTFVGSVVLDQALSNRVQFAVNGANQAGNYAVADVLRIVPAPDSTFPALNPPEEMQFFSTPQAYLMRFAAGAGRQYSIQRSSSIDHGWSTLQIAAPANSGLLEYEEQQAPPGQAFYRILSQ
jgi:hypothetical protein